MEIIERTENIKEKFDFLAKRFEKIIGAKENKKGETEIEKDFDLPNDNNNNILKREVLAEYENNAVKIIKFSYLKLNAFGD